MTTYVLGAGASIPVYPLASQLLDAIDQYIRGCGNFFDRFPYATWPTEIMDWLENNDSVLLRRAFKNGNVEEIFTILDFADSLVEGSLMATIRAGKQGVEAVNAASEKHKEVRRELVEYQIKKSTLMWAMEAYFQDHHQRDSSSYKSDEWKTLRRFAELLQPGDKVVTFNYDSTIERVLSAEGKWSPSTGYGQRLTFQKARNDKTVVEMDDSPIKVIHLHGAVGWYRNTSRIGEAGFCLDPTVLEGFGIYLNVDAAMPQRPTNEQQLLLHPSFLKDYTGNDGGSSVFNDMWRLAGDALRSADKIIIIGYSLPPADSAAWTLLLTNCDASKTTVVNPTSEVVARYRQMFKQTTPPMSILPRLTFAEWIAMQAKS